MSRATRVVILTAVLLLGSPIVSSQLTAVQACLNCYWAEIPDPAGGDPFQSGGLCLNLSDTGWANCLEGYNGCVVDTPCRCTF